jgi:hypothetical protein
VTAAVQALCSAVLSTPKAVACAGWIPRLTASAVIMAAKLAEPATIVAPLPW